MSDPQAPQDDGFSDSDRAWLERLRGRPVEDESSDAVRDADLLRWALEDEQAALRADPNWAEVLSDDALAQQWARVRQQLAEDEAPAPVPAPAPARPSFGARLRALLWPAGPKWAPVPAFATLALLVLVGGIAVLQPVDDIDEGPPLPVNEIQVRGDDAVQRVTGSRPRRRADSFAAALRVAGFDAAVSRRERTAIVDVYIDPDRRAAAAPAFEALGLKPGSGFARVEFDRR